VKRNFEIGFFFFNSLKPFSCVGVFVFCLFFCLLVVIWVSFFVVIVVVFVLLVVDAVVAVGCWSR